MKLKEIVDSINTTLKSELQIQLGEFYGLAKLVIVHQQDDSQTYVATIFNSNGSEIRCQVDDSYPFTIYHRCLSISVTKENIPQYGDGEDNLKETANMIAVVYGRGESVQEDFASMIVASLPPTIDIAELNNVDVIAGSVNNDSFSVYNQEYKSTDYPLNPKDYYFSISYTIETTYDRSCVEKCIN